MNQSAISASALAAYQGWGPQYEHHLLSHCSYQTPFRVARVLRPWVDPHRSACWLDLGAGTGLVGRALIASAAHLQLIAVDLSRELLAQVPSPPYVACAIADVLDASALTHFAADGALAVGLGAGFRG